jgi:hypothetical protein
MYNDSIISQWWDKQPWSRFRPCLRNSSEDIIQFHDNRNDDKNYNSTPIILVIEELQYLLYG